MHTNYGRKTSTERPLGRSRRIWEDIIITGLREIWELWNGFIWISIAKSGGLL
jgi:hypothetical protein